MELVIKEQPFDATIVELFTIKQGDEEYNVEVVVSYGYGLEETEIEVGILEHGLSYEKIDELVKFVEDKFKNVQYNRQLCK